VIELRSLIKPVPPQISLYLEDLAVTSSKRYHLSHLTINDGNNKREFSRPILGSLSFAICKIRGVPLLQKTGDHRAIR
jgi:hypothetical protein